MLGVGEWDRPSGKADWGVIVRDLRNGDVRLVFSEDEWNSIKRHGLPEVGVKWGEPPPAVPEQPGAQEVKSDAQKEMESDWAHYRATQAAFDAMDSSMEAILVYLEYDLGEEMAKDEHFTPFRKEEAAVISEAIRRGTPDEVRDTVKTDEASPHLDALIAWLRSQRSAGQDTPDLKAVLDGNIDVDISKGEPLFLKRG